MFVAEAQAQAPPPVQPNPQAPSITTVVPNGAQPGTTVELVLTGANLAGPIKLWTSFPATVTIPGDNNNGKDNSKLRVRLDVPKDAPLGFHTLRLATGRGVSNFRLFCVDELPQIMEVDTNRSKSSPQAVKVPCVVVGKADAETSDYYKVSVKAGQRLSFEVLGRRLGSALDPRIAIIDPHTQRDLAYDDDAPGLQTDPRLTYTFKDAGDYLIEVRDTKWAGGPDFWYRVRIGDFPCASTPIPMAAKRGTKTTVHFAGPTVDGVPPIEVDVPSDPTVDVVWVTPRAANGLSGWPVALAISDVDEAVEQEPDNEPAKANRITVPGGITGRFQRQSEVDHYVFTAKKGQRLVIQGHTLEQYSPTLLDMVLTDAKGSQVAASNPQLAHPADQRIDFAAPADGDFVLRVKHLTDYYGPAETYRVTVLAYEPGFDLSLGIDRYDVPQGGSTPINIMATRRDYAGPIELSVLGPPGITGQSVINPGQPAAPNQPAAVLLLQAKPDLPMGAYSVVIQGKATIQGKPVIGYASVRTVVSQNLANLPYPPLQLIRQAAVAVTEKPPFTLAVKLDQAEAIRGSPVSLTVTATRVSGFTEEITLAPLRLPPNVAPALKNIAKAQNEVKVQLTPAGNAPLGQFPVILAGKAKFQNTDFSVTAPPVMLVVTLPFDLKVEPATLSIAPGAKAKLKVSAVRKGGYQGPIALELRNLPADVTAPKASIVAGKNEAEMEVTAAANAAVAAKADVNVLGTATAAANQQKASPNFTVSVIKK